MYRKTTVEKWKDVWQPVWLHGQKAIIFRSKGDEHISFLEDNKQVIGFNGRYVS